MKPKMSTLFFMDAHTWRTGKASMIKLPVLLPVWLTPLHNSPAGAHVSTGLLTHLLSSLLCSSVFDHSRFVYPTAPSNKTLFWFGTPQPAQHCARWMEYGKGSTLVEYTASLKNCFSRYRPWKICHFYAKVPGAIRRGVRQRASFCSLHSQPFVRKPRTAPASPC